MLKDSTLDSNLTFIFLVYTAKMNLLIHGIIVNHRRFPLLFSVGRDFTCFLISYRRVLFSCSCFFSLSSRSSVFTSALKRTFV